MRAQQFTPETFVSADLFGGYQASFGLFAASPASTPIFDHFGERTKMEMNHVEMNILEQQAREANADSLQELDDLRLMLVGGGDLAVNFG